MKKKTPAQLFTSLLFIFSVLLFVATAYAGPTIVWQLNSRTEILKGEAHGVSITDTGEITLAPAVTQLFDTGQAYIWSSVADARGNVYLGTGHDGRIYRVTPDGKGAMWYDAAELDVTALAVGADGTLYAGTSPDGKVYRIGADGQATVYFDPPDKYIWSLVVMPDGSLAAGTGDQGKLYRIKGANAKPEDSLLYDTNETHVISLAVDQKGNLLAGTDPGGLVLQISNDGKAFALLDAGLREIHALVTAPDGSIYALALSEAASSSAKSGGTLTSGGDASGATTTVVVSGAEDASAATPAARSRGDLTNVRSAVFRILPDGGADTLWSSTTITAFALANNPRGDGVLVGTSDKGRVYAVARDGGDTLLWQSTEGQISTFARNGNDLFAASSNQGRLFKFGPGTVTDGSYESPVRDAKLVSAWGRIWWQGDGTTELYTRSGNSEAPDATWSNWSAAYRDPHGVAVTSPHARFIQWRAVLRASAGRTNTVRVDDVNIAYVPRNVAPEVLSITITPSGVGLQPQLSTQPDPNIESSGLDPSLFGQTVATPPRKLYQRGARSLQWQAEDRNGDAMEYTIYYRLANESTFRLLRAGIKDNFYTIDGSALPDGRYLIKVVASDSPANAAEQALSGDRTSEPFDLDNTPPVVKVVSLTMIDATHARAVFQADDATGRIKQADVSIDGVEWRVAAPEDGINDSGSERYTLTIPIDAKGSHVVALRVFDTNGNIGSAQSTVVNP
jgi:hypothetical protein